MARGWESKDVESRIQDAESRHQPTRPPMDPQQREQEARKSKLQLQRSRLLKEMREASSDRMLDLARRELAWIDAELEKLG